jgi:hypothetical protein
MSAIDWLEVHGQKFTGDEAREASDFKEILFNYELEPQMIFDLFKDQNISAPKRLVLTIIVPTDAICSMLLEEQDSRIREVIQSRLREERLNASGGILD